MKVLLYHPFIPPYRVDLFNTLSERYETDIVTMYNGAVSYTHLRAHET